jgi:hypothetical protein
MRDNTVRLSEFLMLTVILAILCLLTGTPAKADTYFGTYCQERTLTSDTTHVKFVEATTSRAGFNSVTATLSDGVEFPFETTNQLYSKYLTKLKGGEIIEVDYDIESFIVSHGQDKWCDSRIVVGDIRIPKGADKPASSVNLVGKVVASGLIQGRYEGRNMESDENGITLTLEDGKTAYFAVEDDVKAFGNKDKGKQVVIYYETEVSIFETYITIIDFAKLGKVIK